MPYGLGDISIPKDYLEWATTMYAHFGNKWANLHLGPTWSAEDDSITKTDVFQLKQEVHVENECVKRSKPRITANVSSTVHDLL